MNRHVDRKLLREVAAFIAPFLLLGAVLALVALLFTPTAVAAVAVAVTAAALYWAFSTKRGPA